MSYWNWYRFPGDFTFGGLLEQGIGGLVTGLVVAAALGGARQAKESDLF